jgi:hypothetical protein
MNDVNNKPTDVEQDTDWLQSDCSFDDEEPDDWESSDNGIDGDMYNTHGLIKPTDQMVVIDRAAWDSFVEFALKSSLSIRRVESTNELLAYEETNTSELQGGTLMWYNSSYGC